MNTRLRTVGMAAIAALSVLALAQDAVSLKRVQKVGETTKFTLKAELNMGGIEATYTGSITDKVTKVAENGNVTVETVSGDGKVVTGGQEITAGNKTTVTTTYKPTGEVV